MRDAPRNVSRMLPGIVKSQVTHVDGIFGYLHRAGYRVECVEIFNQKLRPHEFDGSGSYRLAVVSADVQRTAGQAGLIDHSIISDKRIDDLDAQVVERYVEIEIFAGAGGEIVAGDGQHFTYAKIAAAQDTCVYSEALGRIVPYCFQFHHPEFFAIKK